jgi:hypothetical protein
MASSAKSAGTTDTRVDRPDEGLPGIATVSNPTANPPTRATLETAKASSYSLPKPVANIDTSGTSGNQPGADVKRGEPNAW